MLRKSLTLLATIPLGWCIREITKTAVFDWVTRRLEGSLGIEEAKVIAFGVTYAVPLVLSVLIIGLVYWLARGDRRATIAKPFHRSTTPTRTGSTITPPLNKQAAPQSLSTDGLGKLFAVEGDHKFLYLRYLPDNPEKQAFDTMLVLLFGYKEILGRNGIRKSTMMNSLQKSRLKKPLGSAFLSSIASGPLDFYDPDEIYSAGRDNYQYDNYQYDNDRYIEKGSLSRGGAFKLTDAGYERARAIVEDLIEME